jgi:Flp pilus assembly protein TadD
MCKKIRTASSLCYRLLIAVVLLGGMTGFPNVATAGAGTCPEWVARVVSIEGRVEALPAGATQWRTVSLNDTFCPEDQLRTLEKSRAAVQLRNETMLRLDQNTMVKFSAPKPESPSLLELFTGRALFMTRFPRPLTIDTPYVNASSGGTEYVIEVDKEHQTSTLTVIEGTMHLKNAQGTLTVTDGQSSVTHAGGKPVMRVAVNVKDELHWALYYPPVLSLHDLGLGGTEALPASDWRAMVAKSITAYQTGDLERAFAALKNAPPDIDDPRFYTYRASLLLAVGRVGQARSDINQALTLAPRNGLALALQSLIAVVQNRPDKALGLAQEAAAADPESASVRIALSYAWQANFNLAQALTAAQDATRLDPKSALAWARTAELWLSQGYLSEALDAAKRAETLNPREARIQTILGFAYLTQIKPKQAQVAFERAIALNSSEPLSRLGLGLAKIRQGDLSNGRQEIEIAAALDPGNSLIRSYLGKAYYEEKRDKKAAIQFGLAEQLDPKDPTPYSYEAVLKQTTNRPVEALHDIQTAIALNDNRAVYRSRLLLDSDLASRSVSRGRIYQDLGFEQRALIEGFQSVNTDPMNYSAHRFLADSYATLPKSEIARQSALLTSQLLQPINANPVQPSLSNDSMLTAGPGSLNPSFNEYSQLFDSNGLRLRASGIAGQQNTKGDELTLSGIHNRVSWNLGQFYYNTDGFRDNAGLDQKIYDAFVQGQVTSKLSIQGEARLNKGDNGFLSLYYDPDVFSPTYAETLSDHTYRLGAHYAFTPASTILVSALYLHHDEGSLDNTPITYGPGFLEAQGGQQRSHIVETQYLAEAGRASYIAGLGYFSGQTDIYYRLLLGQFPLVDVKSTLRIHHANAYLYTLIHATGGVMLTLGGSEDRYRDETLGHRNQFNPKLGLMWDMSPETTLRLAGLRSMNRELVSNQTIEPTQVAGFQQFFQDQVAADSKLYGIGVDHKFSGKIFSGMEFTKRNVTVPKLSVGTANVEESSRRFRTVRAYLNWTPFSRVTTSVEYYRERYSNEKTGAKTKTQRLPLGVKFFHPGGFFTGLTGSYVVQTGLYVDPTSAPGDLAPPMSSHFWVVDGTIGYRFPRRRGIISLSVRNLTDRRFRMYEFDPNLSTPNQVAPLQPRRYAVARFTLSFD